MLEVEAESRAYGPEPASSHPVPFVRVQSSFRQGTAPVSGTEAEPRVEGSAKQAVGRAGSGCCASCEHLTEGVGQGGARGSADTSQP